MVTTALHRTLLLLYEMQPEEIDALSANMLEERKVVWKTTLKNLARAYGCPNASPRDPSLKDLAELRAMSDEDAASIAKTWSRDVEREINRLFDENPRGNRYYYIKNLEAWAREREQWKSAQIGNVTEHGTSFYALTRFREENDISGDLYVYQGPDPVSENCVNRTNAGIVDFNFVRTNPVPNHPNCVHVWRLVSRQQLECESIWLG